MELDRSNNGVDLNPLAIGMTGTDIGLTIHAGFYKVKINKILDRALHREKRMPVATAKSLEDASKTFKSKTLNLIKLYKAINSRVYKYIKTASKILAPAYIGLNGYNGYVENQNAELGTKIKGIASLTIGVSVELAVGGVSSHGVGVAGAVVGEIILPGLGAVPGYIGGVIISQIFYNYSEVSNHIRNFASSYAKDAWNFSFMKYQR